MPTADGRFKGTGMLPAIPWHSKSAAPPNKPKLPRRPNRSKPSDG